MLLAAWTARQIGTARFQRFDTSQAATSFGIIATLKQYGRSASHRLQVGSLRVTRPFIANFGQEAGSQTFATTWQRSPYFTVRMAQKKAFHLLIVSGNLLYQRQKLGNQSQQQARLGAGGDCIRSATGAVANAGGF